MSTSSATEVKELSPRGAGGVSVLGIRGPQTAQLLRDWGCGKLVPGQLKFVQLERHGEVLDEAIVCLLAHDHAEVHVHGSRPLVRQLLADSNADEPDAARDNIASRACAALAQAPCELAARILLDQAEGAWSRECRRLAAAPENELADGLTRWIARSETLKFAFEPRRVLLAGPVNAGKSTLFNVLVGEERAITSDAEGTTRDLIMERIQLGPWPIDLVDSAGERDLDGELPAAEVERAGQQLARAQQRSADWVLWLDPGDRTSSHAEVLRDARCPVTRLATFADRDGPDRPAPGSAVISALHAPADAAARVLELFGEVFDLPADPWTPGEVVAFDPQTRTWLKEVQALPVDLAREKLSE